MATQTVAVLQSGGNYKPQSITTGGGGLPPNYVQPDGLLVSNASDNADVDHDFAISAGKCRSDDDTEDMNLTSRIVKLGDTDWAEGNNQGGKFFSDGLLNAVIYYIFLIKKDSDGTIDAGIDSGVSATNLPTGWSKKKLLGLLRTDNAFPAGFELILNQDEYFEFKNAVNLTTNSSLAEDTLATLSTGEPAVIAGGLSLLTFNIVLSTPSNAIGFTMRDADSLRSASDVQIYDHYIKADVNTDLSELTRTIWVKTASSGNGLKYAYNSNGGTLSQITIKQLGFKMKTGRVI